MDWYGTDNFAGLPAAFGAALMANETAIRQYNGLTEAEKAEQQALRREYLDEVKANFRAQMEHTSIKEPDGTIHKVIRKN